MIQTRSLPFYSLLYLWVQTFGPDLNGGRPPRAEVNRFFEKRPNLSTARPELKGPKYVLYQIDVDPIRVETQRPAAPLHSCVSWF